MDATDHGPERQPGSRYELDEGDGSWWELGWDAALTTFYAQHHGEAPDGDVTGWFGCRPHEHPSVACLEGALGWRVPPEVRADLEADRASFGGRAWSRAEVAELDAMVAGLDGMLGGGGGGGRGRSR